MRHDKKNRDYFGTTQSIPMTTTLPALQEWVDSVAKLTRPAHIHWCTGSDDENQILVDEMTNSGILIH